MEVLFVGRFVKEKRKEKFTSISKIFCAELEKWLYIWFPLDQTPNFIKKNPSKQSSESEFIADLESTTFLGFFLTTLPLGDGYTYYKSDIFW